MPADGARATLAILNYDGRAHLERMLPTVFAQTATGSLVRVVDDASTDDSVAWLREHWPQVDVVVNERNLGITRSMSVAALSADTEFVAVLNNDLELDPGWLEALLRAMERHPGAAAIDSKLLALDDPSRIDGVGDGLRRDLYPYRRGQGERDRGQYDAPAEVFSASGAAALYRRSAFDRVGPYDGDLVGYYEDVDWGFRARLLGYSCWTAPDAVALHAGSATTGGAPGRFTTLIVRNQILVMVKNLPAALALRWLPRIVWWQAYWLVGNVRHGIGAHHRAALREVLRELPGALRKRRAIQRSRIAGARELARIIG